MVGEYSVLVAVDIPADKYNISCLHSLGRILMLEKDYFAIPELLDFWGITQHDILYLVENKLFNVYVRVFNKTGTYYLNQNNGGIPYELPLKTESISGLYEIPLETVRSLIIHKAIQLNKIKPIAKECDYIRFCREFKINYEDLVVTKEEKQRVETNYGLSDSRITEKTINISSQLKDFKMEELPNGYTKFTYRGKEYVFAFIQSRIVKQLYEAAHNGTIWVYGKTLLKNAGSSSIRLCEVFKRRQDWTDIIKGNKQGLYRLYLE